MKHREWMVAGALVALAATAQAQDIRKCVEHGVIGYQNAPCAAGQVDAGLVKLPDYADPPQRDGASAPANDTFAPMPADRADAPAGIVIPPSAQAAFPFRTSIALGMTDDQVLNIPAWGRPTSIERTGRHRGWHEEWTYARPGSLRTLSFVDGRLANIEIEPPAT
jgi:hypothetical protein